MAEEAQRGLVDVHCHLLPGIDDGPQTVEDAIALARAAVAAGTRTIVVTPHVNHTYPENDAARITESALALRGALSRAGVELELRTGAEVSLTRATELRDEQLRVLRIGTGPYLLVECPTTPSASGFEAALSSLVSRGNLVLLAHVERIPGFREDPDLLERLVAQGMLVQITASSFTGRFGRRAQDFAHHLLRSGLVHDVASDAHHAEHRGPDIAGCLTESGFGSLVSHLARDVPAAILTGAPIPAMPPLPAPPRGGLLRHLRRAS